MNILLVIALAILPLACTKDIENRNTLGEIFPSVVGNSLSGKKWNLPKDFKSKKTLLLIGYKQNLV